MNLFYFICSCINYNESPVSQSCAIGLNNDSGGCNGAQVVSICLLHDSSQLNFDRQRWKSNRKKNRISWFLTRSPKAFLVTCHVTSATFIQIRSIRTNAFFSSFKTTNFILMSFLWHVKWYRFNQMITCIWLETICLSDLKSIYCFLLITNNPNPFQLRDTYKIDLWPTEYSSSDKCLHLLRSRILCNVNGSGNCWTPFLWLVNSPCGW